MKLNSDATKRGLKVGSLISILYLVGYVAFSYFSKRELPVVDIIITTLVVSILSILSNIHFEHLKQKQRARKEANES